ncbi:hypothetical protein BgiBS90_000969 [Biomphalaria glabrata]|nr:hypothetical protein BgiBS90_000969 [Biomphalaria glabrata]
MNKTRYEKFNFKKKSADRRVGVNGHRRVDTHRDLTTQSINRLFKHDYGGKYNDHEGSLGLLKRSIVFFQPSIFCPLAHRFKIPKTTSDASRRQAERHRKTGLVYSP